MGQVEVHHEPHLHREAVVPVTLSHRAAVAAMVDRAIHNRIRLVRDGRVNRNAAAFATSDVAGGKLAFRVEFVSFKSQE